MIKMTAILKKQEGSVIIAALMLLVLLTIVGVAATNNSNFELNITTNGVDLAMVVYREGPGKYAGSPSG